MRYDKLKAGKPLVYIIVLNFNGCEHLGYCLPSLATTTYPNYQILVVDNASPDGSGEMVAELCPSGQLICNSQNLGWSGGNNVGIRAALEMGAEYVVLANNDIRVDPRWVSEAVIVAESDSQIGVIGFRVLEPEPGSTDRDAGFEHANATWAKIEYSYPKYVGGMAMFVRAELFEQIGLIDEGFFAYGEENDFQIRARKAGYTIVSINVPVWHYGQATFGKTPMRAAVLQTRGNIRLLIKHGTPLELIHAGIAHISSRILSFPTSLPSSAVEQRLQASNPIINFVILVWGLAWNLWMLPLTLKRRWDDNRRAKWRQGSNGL